MVKTFWICLWIMRYPMLLVKKIYSSLWRTPPLLQMSICCMQMSWLPWCLPPPFTCASSWVCWLDSVVRHAGRWCEGPSFTVSKLFWGFEHFFFTWTLDLACWLLMKRRVECYLECTESMHYHAWHGYCNSIVSFNRVTDSVPRSHRGLHRLPVVLGKLPHTVQGFAVCHQVLPFLMNFKSLLQLHHCKHHIILLPVIPFPLGKCPRSCWNRIQKCMPKFFSLLQQTHENT